MKRTLPQAVADLELGMINEALRESGGRVAAAARTLGIPASTLADKLRKYGIDPVAYEPHVRLAFREYESLQSEWEAAGGSFDELVATIQFASEQPSGPLPVVDSKTELARKAQHLADKLRRDAEVYRQSGGDDAEFWSIVREISGIRHRLYVMHAPSKRADKGKAR